MAGRENGGERPFGDDRFAAMAMAFDAPTDDGDDDASDEPDTTQEAEEPSADEAPTDDGVVPDAGETTDEQQDATEESAPEAQTDATPEGTAGQPYRSFATEAEYQQELTAATRRASEAQSAIARQLQTIQGEREGEREELETLKKWRNEIYYRLQREELTPEHLVEAYTRHNGEVRGQIATERSTRAAADAERQRAEQEQQLGQRAARTADEVGVLRQTNALLKELAPVEGFDAEAAYQGAFTRPEISRFARLSHTAPDAETRTWARDEAYRLARELVVGQHGALTRAAAKTVAAKAAPKPKAMSAAAGAAQATGSPIAHIRDRMEMLSTAYSQGE